MIIEHNLVFDGPGPSVVGNLNYFENNQYVLEAI